MRGLPAPIARSRSYSVTRRCAGSAGYTLVELLVAVSMLGAILTALLGLMHTTQPAATRDQSRATGIMDAQTGLARMTRDLRQAQAIYAATGTSVDFKATIGGVTQRILYDCSLAQAGTAYKRCVKATSTSLNTAPSATSGATVITDVLNGTAADPSSVFAYTPSATAPTFIAVHLVVPASNGYYRGYSHNISFDDGVYLPNLGTQ